MTTTFPSHSYKTEDITYCDKHKVKFKNYTALVRNNTNGKNIMQMLTFV